MPVDTSKLLEVKSWFIEKQLSDLVHPLGTTIKNLLLVSDFACKNIQILKALLATDDCAALLSRQYYFQELDKLVVTVPQTVYFRELRQFRHKHYLRLMLLQLSNNATTQEVMRSWSDCADAIILHALSYCKRIASMRYGIPRDGEGREVLLLILAMGKLGGSELNYSSDIDLVFAYTAEGETDGEESLVNQQYFSKVVQQFSQILHTVTSEGFVFRVDLRLRPNGDSGPLVCSLAAMETYYQDQGRDWERYAMVKARVIAPDMGEKHPWFVRLITPFVYRRYVDFSVIESLRSMKAMIEREVKLNPRLNDIKRGQGGIREVEFIIQNVQLIRGGRLPQLQLQNALAALAVLKELKLLSHTDALRKGYLFLRRLENTLQSLNDQQTHSLPDDSLKQMQVTLAMGYSSWDDLLRQLRQFQRIISYAFHSVLGKVDNYEDDKRLLANQLASLWHGHVEENMAVNLLASLGFTNAPYCYQMIHAFRHGPRCRRLSQGARMRLDRFMVLLLTELIDAEQTDQLLLQVMHLLEHIVGRSAYLALLTENPLVLKELLFWFSHSPFISSLLVNQPFLLEVLLEQGDVWRPQSYQQLQALLLEKLSHHHDLELQEDLLRQFKLIHWLMAARAELRGLCNAVRIGQFLTDLAQVIVIQVLHLASKQLESRYPEMQKVQANFAIIAYGKLGSREMNYASDLDLVFLHTLDLADEALVTRLTQKILHMLTTRSQSGVLYSVDTRLRPSGSAGLLVSHLDSFAEYQKNQAWIWEHQALLKARILTGNLKIRHQFLELKKSVLLLPRNKSSLQQEVLAMRNKMDQHQDLVKQIPGGLWDLEFLVQFLVLDWGNPLLARYTHTLSQLRHLVEAGVLSREQFAVLHKAYRQYHHLLHHNVLGPNKAAEETLSALVANIYRQVLQD